MLAIKKRFSAAAKELFKPALKINLHNDYENWWFKNRQKLENSWIEKFTRYHKIPKHQWISCFGNREETKVCKSKSSVFFGPENLQDRFHDFSDFMLDEVQLGMGFEFRTDENYMRFPLWLMYFTAPDIDDPGRHFELSMMRRWSADRPFFCAQIASHDSRGGGAGLRTLCSSTLSEIEPVLNLGRHLNNTDLLQRQYADNTDYLLRDFRFNICLENSAYPGYVTEKIFRPLRSGSIPIYWGDQNPEPEVLNPQSILFFNPSNKTELKNQVSKLNGSIKYRQKFLNQNKINSQARDWINSKHHELAKRLSSL